MLVNCPHCGQQADAPANDPRPMQCPHCRGVFHTNAGMSMPVIPKKPPKPIVSVSQFAFDDDNEPDEERRPKYTTRRKKSSGIVWLCASVAFLVVVIAGVLLYRVRDEQERERKQLRQNADEHEIEMLRSKLEFEKRMKIAPMQREADAANANLEAILKYQYGDDVDPANRDTSDYGFKLAVIKRQRKEAIDRNAPEEVIRAYDQLLKEHIESKRK